MLTSFYLIGFSGLIIHQPEKKTKHMQKETQEKKEGTISRVADVWVTILEFLPIYQDVSKCCMLNRFFYYNVFKDGLMHSESYKKQVSMLERTRMYFDEINKLIDKKTEGAGVLPLSIYKGYLNGTGHDWEFKSWGASLMHKLYAGDPATLSLEVSDNGTLMTNTVPIKLSFDKFAKLFGVCPTPRSILSFEKDALAIDEHSLRWIEPFDDDMVKQHPFLSNINMFISCFAICAFDPFRAWFDIDGDPLDLSTRDRQYFVSQAVYAHEFKNAPMTRRIFGRDPEALPCFASHLAYSLFESPEPDEQIMHFYRGYAKDFARIIVPADTYIKKIEPVITKYRFIRLTCEEVREK